VVLAKWSNPTQDQPKGWFLAFAKNKKFASQIKNKNQKHR
jgi:hypothetical protein